MSFTHLLGTVLCMLVTAAGSPGQQQPRPLIFGINAGVSDAQLEAAKAAGCTNIRIGAGWDLVEPEPGVFKWDEPDHAVAQCEKYSLEPIFLIVATPKWALAPEQRDKPWGWAVPPEFYPQARRFYRMVAERYKGRVRYYEFWNEQNGYGWHAGNKPEEYAPVLKLAYTAIKEVDPDCLVAVGGLDGGGWKGYPRYLERLYELGCGDFFDAVAVHPYRADGPIDGHSLKRIHQILVSHGHGDRKLWITEYGWSKEYGHDLKARWLAESLDMLTSPEFHFVVQASVHTLRDFDGSEYGLCDRKGNPRAAYYVFKEYPKDWKAIADRHARLATIPVYRVTDDFENGSHAWKPFGAGFEIVPAARLGIPPEAGSRVLTSCPPGRRRASSRGGSAAVDGGSGGAYLRLAIPERVPIRLSARVFTVHGDGSKGGVRVGIDPAGGTDPEAPSVIWSRVIETYDAWDTVGVGQGDPILPSASHVTLFLRYDRTNKGRGPRIFDQVEFVARPDPFRLPGSPPGDGQAGGTNATRR
ncbi:MAG TPA: hypothetical protein PLQ89_09005 [Phycisphaerae bacterium]|nr:hypothetical protein [Phycisphaerae bacterium]HOJ76294.1 hypothetical protein [Phycisphaerae bacterium]HOM52559.1 hypothetical protein [Phycisphaerae bacterium]HON67646.1 hypothetical protein [Phycisphaerae bacterium]HOQ85843.1 hypothetical protein [Phycisphaerae bacterium]